MKMEVIDERSRDLHVAEGLKSVSAENDNTVIAVAADLCQNSNGVDELGKAGQSEKFEDGTGATGNMTAPETGISEAMTIPSETNPEVTETIGHDTSVTTEISANENDITTSKESSVNIPPKDQDVSTVDVDELVTEVVIEDVVEKPGSPDGILQHNMTESSSDNIPKFKTEVVIEASDSIVSDADGHDTSNNILSEFGESIELSEVLRTDVTEPTENNNGTVRQEVFNKEELLDILQGNDVEIIPPVEVSEAKHVFKSPSKEIETKLALQQLSRLQKEKKKIRGTVKMTKIKKDKKYGENKGVNNIGSAKEKKLKIKSNQASSKQSEDNGKIISNDVESSTEKDTSTYQSKNIVNVLVMDWDDDEQETNESNQSKEKIIEKENETETVGTNQGETKNEKVPVQSEDPVLSEEQIQKEKSGEDNQPQRRLGRVIKKKVIFDPDNPDTFTKTKTKIKEAVKDNNIKEEPPVKKGKQEQTPSRSKSKSPMSNLHWKKPSSKNNKQNRRLTEVDKLLMDEGAVNMIYQLTPEAPKGKKSRETKAEFIKKIQSSTPDSKEMKFRERKIMKYEDGEAKKILGGKHRVSLNSSIKSPSVSEDFETHSADDSIIYRRHSSSSYSSSCMSPRRLSDVDSSSAQSTTRTSQKTINNQNEDNTQVKEKHNVSTSDQGIDVFMAKSPETSSMEINKDDYLSIKEKLNSKLSLALNKRKRESTKNEKPLKPKKNTRNDDGSDTKSSLGELKHVTIKIDQRLAEITIGKTGFQHNVQVLKEIEQALIFVNSIKETSVTLLTECCTLCSNLDLKHLVEDDKIQRVNNAMKVAETISSLLLTLDKHSKVVCCGVDAECRGVGLGVAALCDVVLASERASFALAEPPQPAAAALTARCRLPRPMVDDLILFGRHLSASEALNGGLVSRVLWPDRFTEQVYSIAKDIASGPASSLMLKKNLLNLKKIGEGEQTFPSCLDAERDIFVQYWTTVEGQELLRANVL